MLSLEGVDDKTINMQQDRTVSSILPLPENKTPRNTGFRGVYKDGTRYWFRTSDPMRVKHVLYH